MIKENNRPGIDYSKGDPKKRAREIIKRHTPPIPHDSSTETLAERRKRLDRTNEVEERVLRVEPYPEGRLSRMYPPNFHDN